MGKQEIDFNDEDAVLAAMAAELELDDLAIDDGGRGFSSLTALTACERIGLQT